MFSVCTIYYVVCMLCVYYQTSASVPLCPVFCLLYTVSTVYYILYTVYRILQYNHTPVESYIYTTILLYTNIHTRTTATPTARRPSALADEASLTAATTATGKSQSWVWMRLGREEVGGGGVSIRHTAHSTQHTAHNIQHKYTAYSTQHTAHSKQQTAYSTQHTAHSTHYTSYSTHHTTYSTQYTAHPTGWRRVATTCLPTLPVLPRISTLGTLPAVAVGGLPAIGDESL
jgi:hypothetical protein